MSKRLDEIMLSQHQYVGLGSFAVRHILIVVEKQTLRRPDRCCVLGPIREDRLL
jgi:hypothetical protein